MLMQALPVLVLPEVPTIHECGLAGFEVIGWWGMLAPARTPRPVVMRLNREIRAVLEGEAGKRLGVKLD